METSKNPALRLAQYEGHIINERNGFFEAPNWD